MERFFSQEPLLQQIQSSLCMIAHKLPLVSSMVEWIGKPCILPRGWMCIQDAPHSPLDEVVVLKKEVDALGLILKRAMVEMHHFSECRETQKLLSALHHHYCQLPRIEAHLEADHFEKKENISPVLQYLSELNHFSVGLARLHLFSNF